MHRHARRLRYFVVAAVAASSGTSSLASAQALFTTTGPLNTARYSHSATLLGSGKVLIAGGRSWLISPNVLQSSETYDPVTGTFSPGPNLQTAR